MVSGHILEEFERNLNEFDDFRNEYNAMKLENKTLKKMLHLERLKTIRLKDLFNRMKDFFHIKREHYYLSLSRAHDEQEILRIALTDAKAECEHLRLINADSRNEQAEISRLEDELEVAQAQLDFQAEKFNEELAAKDRKHQQEIEQYKSSIQNLKEQLQRATFTNAKKLVSLEKKSKDVKHEQKKSKDIKHEQNKTSLFKWPALSITKRSVVDETLENTQRESVNITASTSTSVIEKIKDEDNESKVSETTIKKEKPVVKKKRKLFYEDEDDPVDI
ncbi:rho GTPase-activating protein gacN-like [Prorops nasuta]|uniref:rho GTPase-activating protein gacN-like n=1 Tax=Prorops nasuta TaxID=863751 RepID=UPI0034CD6EEF